MKKKLVLLSYWKEKGLRDTGPRRLIIEALRAARRPVSPAELHSWIRASHNTIHLVTVYRILRKLEEVDLVHRHPCNGLYSLCSLQQVKGHHGFLHCNTCGSIEEFCEPDLCRLEDRIAKNAKFTPLAHVSEIVGICHACV